MSGLLLLLPLLLPLAGTIVLLAGSLSVGFQRVGAVVCSGLTLVASLALLVAVDRAGILVVQLGSWEAPFGISLVADRLSAVMVAFSALLGAAVAVFSLGEISRRRIQRFFYPLYLLLLFGVNGAFLTGDLFNLYVWFEVMLIASFVLTALGGGRAELEGGLKYVILNLFSSALFLSAAGILYGVLGTLNLADLAVRLAASPDPGWLQAASLLILVAFGLKAAVFPLFFWLPASYHTPPSTVSAIFAGLLTKVGVYALIRVYTLVFEPLFPQAQGLLLAIAVLTMITGVLGAAAHFEMRRILSFHIVSQIGYMVLGLAFFTPLALAAAIFYIIHNMVAKTNLLLISGIVIRLQGTADLARVGGLYRSAPWLAVLFFLPAFSLAGIPPLSGFWAKLGVVRAGLEGGWWFAVAAALVVGILTLYSMTKIWAEAFWKPRPEGALPLMAGGVGRLGWMVVPVATLSVCTVALGVFGEFLFAFSERAADQLLSPQEYISTVLAGRGKE